MDELPANLASQRIDIRRLASVTSHKIAKVPPVSQPKSAITPGWRRAMRLRLLFGTAAIFLLPAADLSAQAPRPEITVAAPAPSAEPGAGYVIESPSDLPKTGANCPCDRCHCAPCECPTEPAPCLPCPHVSTLLPYWNVNIFGALQANVMFNTARPVAPAIPLFLAPGSVEPENTVDVFARPSNLGAIFSGPEIGDFRVGGMVWMFLYNDALIVDRYGILPVQAWGDLKNEDWRFAAGLQFNVFAPNLPNMRTFSSLFASGNPGNNFLGQFRIERYLFPTDDSQWTFQFALSDPIPTGVITEEPISTIITGNPALRINEDNGWPTLEGRVAWSVGEVKQEGLEAKRALAIGASFVGGQLRTGIAAAPDVVANVFGLAADFRWRVNDRWGVLGEAFFGEGLGFQNAGVLQSTNSGTFDSIRTRGAWGEVYYYLTPCLHTHWGTGFDDPINRDLAASQIAQNRTFFANLIWDLTRQLRVGFEFTWRKTDYVRLPDNDGVGLHTQVQWAF